MKKLVKTEWLVASALVLFAACEKEEGLQDNLVEGTYTGTLTGEGTKSAGGIAENMAEATAHVIIVGENEIQVNCYTSDFDTTFMLNYYEHHDSAYVCFTGDNFKEMYGHMLGSGHMMGGMMGDITNGETEWMHHMGDEHNEGDEHYGGFDMMNHTFGYRFQMMDGDSSYWVNFHGAKNQ
ncbi:MAG: hypothetical protein WD577_04675 [Bacteroidales bacterium]